MNNELDWIDKPQFDGGEQEEIPENLDELVEAIEAKEPKDFADLYGFEHNCHCAEDWKNGNTGMVAQCYTEMCDDALDKCHEFKGRIAHLERKIGVLRDQVRRLGEEPTV